MPSNPSSPAAPTHDDADVEIEAEESVGDPEETNDAELTISKGKSKNSIVRELGKTMMPFSRVQKIIKADREIPIMAKEATFLICIATEAFIARICAAGFRYSDREKRSIFLHRDLMSLVQRADEFMFLDEVFQTVTAAVGVRKRKPKALEDIPSLPLAPPTLMDKFVVPAKTDTREKSESQVTVSNTDEAAPSPVDSQISIMNV